MSNVYVAASEGVSLRLQELCVSKMRKGIVVLTVIALMQ